MRVAIAGLWHETNPYSAHQPGGLPGLRTARGGVDLPGARGKGTVIGHGEQLRSVGIEPSGATIITAKGAIAWRAACGDVAGTVIEVDTPGICPVDPEVLERTTQPMRV